VFLGLAYNSPPPPSAVRLFDLPMLPVSTPQLPDLPRPAMVVGSKPCERIASAVSAQDDVVYVAVIYDPAEVVGSEHWVDDFIVRPSDYHDICQIGERALVRKRRCHAPKAIVSDIAFAWLGQSVELSPLQAKIVQLLVEANGTVVTEREMAYLLWGHYIDDPGRAIEAHIYRLRKRLNEMHGVHLQTIRQRGFQLLLSEPRSDELIRGAG
jgi:hypothetical protein